MGFASVPIPSREKIIEMNIQLDNDKITIGVDGLNQSNELKRYLEKYENHIFQLQREGDSVAFVKIGNRETACNESINVLYSSDDEIVRKISNLGHSPFEMDGIRYGSVEGFWQGLKFEGSERLAIAKLFGKEAKRC